MESLKIGWLGTGVMGKPLAGHLISHGYKVHVYNRTKSKTDSLVEKGAIYMTPSEIAQNCNVIFMMLGYPQDVKNIVYGDNGIINFVKPETIIVDHSTNSPQFQEQIYKDFKEKGVSFLDIPVSGADVMAEKGELNLLVGGDKEAFEAIIPLLKCYSKAQNYFGPSGKGQEAKLCAQIMLATNLAGVCEGLIFAIKTGLNPHQTFEVLQVGGASSGVLSIYPPRILKGDLEPTISVELFVKDLELVLKECRRYHIVLPIIAQLRQFYESLMANGYQQKGFQAIILTLAQLNGIEKEFLKEKK